MYWDACSFIGLLNQEPDKANDCTEVWREAERGDTIIITSFLSFAEVYKAKCEGNAKPLSDAHDERVVQLLRQPWIHPAVVDERIAVLARQLLRRHPECKKPTDGIHLATALTLNVVEMHTFDRADLLGLDGSLFRADGEKLRICTPKPIPAPEPKTLPLFEQGRLSGGSAPKEIS